MLVIRAFAKSYHHERIVSIEALSLGPGTYLFKGDNGTGKTTLFKCLAGISPCTGEISLQGTSLHQDPIAYRYYVNFAEAEPLYPEFLTSRDIMRFVGKTKNSTEERLHYYCQKLGIEWFYEKSCGTYSSGMLKKLSLAIAFLGEPKMIILDEPLITLDDVTRHQLFDLIKEKKETIFLLSSHQSIEHRLLGITNTFKIENKTVIPE